MSSPNYHLSPNLAPSRHHAAQAIGRPRARDTHHPVNLHFSIENVEKLLRSVDANKNGGPDGIPNIFLIKTAQYLAPPLTSIFNKSISTGVFPSQFKNANVMPIFKKGLKTDVRNYRPICLLNSFSKIFERLVHDEVMSFLDGFFDSNQHGFLKGKSTMTNTSIFVNAVAKNLEVNTETHAIYTDFAKAFDSVDFRVLLGKLERYGIRGNILKWFEAYLAGRELRVVFNGSLSAPFTPPSGVPQGSVLGPLLFNIFINDLGEHIMNSYLLFADDLKIYAKIRTLNDIIEPQNDLNRLSNWCRTNKLSLNTQKCKFISFTAKRIPLPTTYNIDGTPLEQVTSINDLGILLDSKLKFNLHIDNIYRKSLKMLGFLIRVTSKFSDPNCLQLLYNSLVRSNLEFQTQTWSPYQSTFKQRLERIQRKFTRLLFFKTFRPYADYNSRLVELGMISLEDRRKYFDISLLHATIHNPALTPLSDQLLYRHYPRSDRRPRQLFRISPTRTYYGRMTDPIARAIRLFNNEFGEIDIIRITHRGLKTTLLQHLNFNLRHQTNTNEITHA